MFCLGLLTAIAFWPGYIGASIATNWVVLSCLLPFALWRETTFTPLHGAFIAFLAWGFLTLFWAINVFDGLNQLWFYSILGLAFWLGSTRANLARLFLGLAAGLTVSSAVSIFQAVGFQPLETMGQHMTAGLFYNSMVQGEAITLVVLGLLAHRLWWAIPGLLPGLYLSNSRGAWAALAIGVLAMYVRKPLILASVAAAIFIIATARLGGSDIQRMQIWYAAWANLTFLGNGAGSFLTLWFHTPTSLVHPEYVHNDFLQFVFEYGVGSVLLLAVLGACACCTQAQQWPIYIAFLFMACFSFPFLCPVTAFIGTVCAGRIAADWNWSWTRGIHSRHGFLSRVPQRQSFLGLVRRSTVPAELRTS